MEAIWFAIVSGMLAVYTVLDGFDFGVGILHPLVARTDAERRTVFAAIGPIWDGNEVWLIAAGGVLFLAFPKVYAAAFSGFYLALMIVLWLLILRGIAIELRSRQESPLWRDFWDTVFSLASLLLAFVLGVALANVVRGVPLDAEGTFFIPLFTDFQPGLQPGVFDWYTALVGILAVCALAGHGAFYLVWKTSGPVQARSRFLASRAWLAVLALWPLATLATARARPDIVSNYYARPWFLVFLALMAAGAAGVHLFSRRGRDLVAFLSSAAFLLGLLASTVAGVYPVWLRSTLDPAQSLTIMNSAADSYGLQVALVWWTAGMVLAGGYFAYLFRSTRGKVEVQANASH
jgi:cytochrome d ubiquinol oxidase subunit II